MEVNMLVLQLTLTTEWRNIILEKENIHQQSDRLNWFGIVRSFKDKTKAYDFEKYLKHGSGHAFVNKHLV